MHKRPISVAKLRKVPSQFSWVDQCLVRERYIDQLSHEACALYLFLVTVADAQGLSFYSERSLCQRLSMTPAVLRQARQALIEFALVADQSPLYQVLALDGDARQPVAALSSPRHQFIYTSADASRLYRNDRSPAILTRRLARVERVFCLSPAYLLVELQFLRYSRLDSANM
jgi:hypothetical protein